ncbi:MAG: DUF1844 domain-containing protein [Planctomycetota bacterium]
MTETPDDETDLQETNDADDASEFEIPEASFSTLVSLLATQALAALQMMPDGSEPPPLNKPLAKLHIDLLELLGEKTQETTTEDERKGLSEVLHMLRMAFVNAGK